MPDRPPRSGARPEEEVLLLAMRGDPDPLEGERMRRLLAGDIDVQRLLTLAAWHGLAPLLHRRLESWAPDAAEPELREGLRRRAREAARRSLVLTARLLEAIEAFRAEDIDVLAFKGPTLALEAYGDLALREYADIDLLVRPADVGRASAVLVGLSFESRASVGGAPGGAPDRAEIGRECQRTFLRRGGTEQIELHWEFFPRRLAVDLDPGAALDRRRTVSIGGRPVPTLAREDLLLHLAVHGGKHLWARLEWILAFAGALRAGPFDRDLIERRCGHLGLRRTVAGGLILARDLVGSPLPEGAESLCGGDRGAARLARRWRDGILRRGANGPAPRELVLSRIASRERAVDRARCLFRLAVLPDGRDVEAIGLPAPLAPLYAVLRPLCLLGRCGWKALARGSRG